MVAFIFRFLCMSRGSQPHLEQAKTGKSFKGMAFMKKYHRLTWLGLVVVLSAPQVVLSQWSSVGDGVEYREWTISGPNNLFVARLIRSNTNTFIESTIGQGRLSGGTETVRSQASRYDDAIGYWGQSWGSRNDVVVAINGSYYNTTTGVPESGLIHSGWYAKRYTDFGGWSGFVWQLDRDAYIGECLVHNSSKQLITYVSDGSANTKILWHQRVPGRQ